MERGREMTENSYNTPCGCIHYFVNIIDKQKITLVFLPGLTADHMHYPDHLRIITVCLTWQNGLIKS